MIPTNNIIQYSFKTPFTFDFKDWLKEKAASESKIGEIHCNQIRIAPSNSRELIESASNCTVEIRDNEGKVKGRSYIAELIHGYYFNPSPQFLLDITRVHHNGGYVPLDIDFSCGEKIRFDFKEDLDLCIQLVVSERKPWEAPKCPHCQKPINIKLST